MNISGKKIVKTKNSLQVGNKQYATNNKGYLINFNDWDKEFTITSAEIDYLKLTKCHWDTVDFLRSYYREYEVPPTPHVVIKTIGSKINTMKCTQKDISKAFPLGGCKQACRIAGLPLHHCNAC